MFLLVAKNANVLHRKVHFVKNNVDIAGGLNPKLRLAGDWDLWRRMAAITDYIQTPWPMGIFRVRPGQISQNLSEYVRETEKIIPLKTRRKILRKVIKKLHLLPVHVLHEVNGDVFEKTLTLNSDTISQIKYSVQPNLFFTKFIYMRLKLREILPQNIKYRLRPVYNYAKKILARY
jgi:NRPS condensation-like uncharacterized protein